LGVDLSDHTPAPEISGDTRTQTQSIRVRADPTGLGLFAIPKYKCVLPVFFALFLKMLSQICFIFFVDFFIDVAGKKSLSRQ
jgi:hypothetical protein